mmetsp:Transcript_22670/g.63231  ORF Transcript_22670/g.63231 Transcript_22670/m.63231 type:complete len:242 (+) Transcript_22670:249-974(+)
MQRRRATPSNDVWKNGIRHWRRRRLQFTRRSTRPGRRGSRGKLLATASRRPRLCNNLLAARISLPVPARSACTQAMFVEQWGLLRRSFVAYERRTGRWSSVPRISSGACGTPKATAWHCRKSARRCARGSPKWRARWRFRAAWSCRSRLRARTAASTLRTTSAVASVRPLQLPWRRRHRPRHRRPSLQPPTTIHVARCRVWAAATQRTPLRTSTVLSSGTFTFRRACWAWRRTISRPTGLT